MTLVLHKGFAGPLSGDIADYPDGIIVPVDKPYRWTSADVIRKVKYAAVRHFGKKNLKVGHAGTLDPLATGVLLVCIGAATRQAQSLQDHDKEYVAGISFGATTPSYDLEKEVDRTFPTDGVTEAALRAVLPGFIGEQEQVAPLFSAKSVDGVRAYEMARRLYRRARSAEPSAAVADFDAAALAILRTSRITIHEAELLSFRPAGTPSASCPAASPAGPRPASAAALSAASARIHVADTSALALPFAEVRLVCSKGTYVRAFARDLGEALGSGAHLASLTRTRTGSFVLPAALSLPAALALF